MDGIHDLGGKAGFGGVDTESGKLSLKLWEQRVLSMVNGSFGAGLIGNVDQFRHAIERIDPVSYLSDGYYGRWLGGLETLLVEGGVITIEDVNDVVRGFSGQINRVAARPSSSPDRITYPPAKFHGMRTLTEPPLFAVGQKVIAARHGHLGHTRLPQYARGKQGTIVTWHQSWVYPDTNAHGHGENPQHLYTVRFNGEELWGQSAEPGTIVHLDLFEPYLGPVETGGTENHG